MALTGKFFMETTAVPEAEKFGYIKFPGNVVYTDDTIRLIMFYVKESGRSGLKAQVVFPFHHQ